MIDILVYPLKYWIFTLNDVIVYFFYKSCLAHNGDNIATSLIYHPINLILMIFFFTTHSSKLNGTLTRYQKRIKERIEVQFNHNRASFVPSVNCGWRLRSLAAISNDWQKVHRVIDSLAIDNGSFPSLQWLQSTTKCLTPQLSMTTA